jgi:hypothetical protein
MYLTQEIQMPTAAYEQASKLRDKALKGFKSSHATLSKANILLDQYKEEQARLAEQYRLENAIQIAERQAKDAAVLHDSNQKTIDLLSGLIGS